MNDVREYSDVREHGVPVRTVQYGTIRSGTVHVFFGCLVMSWHPLLTVLKSELHVEHSISALPYCTYVGVAPVLVRTGTVLYSTLPHLFVTVFCCCYRLPVVVVLCSLDQ